MPKYCEEIINTWSKRFSFIIKLSSAILLQLSSFNNQILIDNSLSHFKCFSENNIEFVKQLFNLSGTFKDWKILKQECNLKGNCKFKWIQLIHPIPVTCEDSLAHDKEKSFKIPIQRHHLIKRNQVFTMEIMQIISQAKEPSSPVYFENCCQNYDFESRNLFILKFIHYIGWSLLILSVMRAFQYKVLHNSHFLNQKVFLFLKFASPLCSFSDNVDEKCYTFFWFMFFTTVLWKKNYKVLF